MRSAIALFLSITPVLAACGGGGGPDRPDAGDGGQDPNVVMTEFGPITGAEDTEGGVVRYFEIPYAGDPSGANRYRPPQAPAAWTTPRPVPAAGAGRMCPQRVPFGSANISLGESEDCLYANIVTPYPRPTGAPVIVWIHGGAFSIGSGGQPDGKTFGERIAASHDVIVVTFNYRLGQFGFLAHPALSTEQGGHSGNYGLLDQLFALRWIKRNIAAFGGDPNNITVYGQSAGAQSICALMTTPLVDQAPEQPLFHRAILSSGFCDVPFLPLRDAGGSDGNARNDAEDQGVAFVADIAECDGMDALTCLRRDLSPLPFLEEGHLPPTTDFIRQGPNDGNWGPVLDDFVFPFAEGMPQHPMDRIAAGSLRKIPIMIGFTADEGTVGVMYRTLRNVNTDPTHAMRIDDAKDGDPLPSCTLPMGCPTYRSLASATNGLFTGGAMGTELADVAAVSRYQAASYTSVTLATPPGPVTPEEQAFAAIHTDMSAVCPTRRTLRTLAEELEGSGNAVYAYMFAYDNPPFQVTPTPFPLGAFSVSDVQFVFGRGASPSGNFTAEQRTLSDAMQGYFARFAQTGDPNGTSGAPWPAYTAAAPEYLVFDTTIATMTDPRATECTLWDGFGGRDRIGTP